MANGSSHRVENNQDNGWLESTSLFRQWSQIKQEILLHKWYESEKAGYDIGWEKASVDWMVHHGRNR